jgi:CheY-like chemotaxis protein
MPGRILVVDDDPNVLRLMSYIVQQEGYQVVSAESGAEALEIIENDPPELVILDLLMPGVSGFHLCEYLRTEPSTANIRILAVTGYAEPANMRRILAMGANEYVEKPLNVDEFLVKVGRLAAEA